MSNQKLPQFLAEHSPQIKTAFIRNKDISVIQNKDISVLLLLQQKLVFANEEELVNFGGFLLSENFHLDDDINTTAYMAVLNTAKSRITLLSLYLSDDCEEIFQLLVSLSIWIFMIAWMPTYCGYFFILLVWLETFLFY